MSILKKMKKKWYALNSHRIDEIEDQKAVEKLLKFVEELRKQFNLKQL